MPLQLLGQDSEITVLDSELQGVDDGDPEVSYRVRLVSHAVNVATTKKHTTNQHGRGPQSNDMAILHDLLDYALVGWTGVKLGDADAPCTRDHKVTGLDLPRKRAIVVRACSNQITRAEVRDASFRQSPEVV